MTDTATHPGVVDNDTSADDLDTTNKAGDESTERPLSARELAMEELHAKRRQEIATELGGEIDEQIATQTEDEPAQPDTQAQASTVRVKVDGEELDVPLDELKRQYQKNAAADKRLEEASRLLREAKEASERAAQIKAQQGDEPAPNVSTARAATPPDDSSAPAIGELHTKFVTSLYEGDDANSAKLLDELVEAKLQARAGATQSRADIVAEVKKQLEEDSAFEQFSKAFDDIWSDPYLSNIADQHLSNELNSGKHPNLNSALTAAGLATRDWMRSRGMKVKEERTQTADLNARLERKAGLPQLPSASVRATSMEEPPANAASVIAEMRRARGQA